MGLVLLSCLTSFISASAGLGGGVILLAVMASLLPPNVLIPVHGVIQIGSNAGRTGLMLAHVDWRVWAWFLGGSVLGASAGALVAIRLPAEWLQIILGIFILWTIWGRFPVIPGRAMVTVTGIVSSFLTMFVGATGPFLAAMARGLKLDRMTYVATHGACMTMQHTIKVLAFGLLGFAYGPYLPLIFAMIASGFVGSILGKRVLIKLGDDRFQWILNAILTLLAIRLVLVGLLDL
ncbi:MAG: sulfite exporter TauE/SafE family protein [Geminicoccaceae bacterium]